MILLLDIGNTHTHLGVANTRHVVRQGAIPTHGWFSGRASASVRRFFRRSTIEYICLCSVVPRATKRAVVALRKLCGRPVLELTPKTLRGVGIDYPRPATIGPDRLANAVAVHHYFGAPSVVVDFGTAVTFDVVDRKGNYSGGIIAPGLAVMTDYLHEKTALLPRIMIRDTKSVIGKSTSEAMLIGAVQGYRGLVRALLTSLRRELKSPRLPVVATGGYAELMADKMPEITAVNPRLTLEGLRLVALAHQAPIL
ncbi:MAG: type III pantothenate kinase [Verrucomicrobia subdivision 3 bacterium]|nr:type III pantothenate kinase [Limisphaerales bacterium]